METESHAETRHKSFEVGKRVARTLFGFGLLLLGMALVLTPAPGWLVMLAALSILAAEFEWANILLTHLRNQTARLRHLLFARS